MEFSWSIFVVLLLLLGAVQLAVGVVLGRCLPWGNRNLGLPRSKGEAPTRIDPQRLHFFASRLCNLVADVSGDVGDHRNQIAEISRDLAGADTNDGDALTDCVLRSLARIVNINERLQNRLESAEQRLQQQNEQIVAHFTESRTDPLTGLMNRRAFDDALRYQADQGSRPFALIMIDVDRFKDLNDQHGHPAGDHVLRGMSGRLEAVLAGAGMIARYGGEEFAVIVPAVGAAEARQIAERLRIAVASAPFILEHTSLALSVSLGVSLVTPHDDPMTGVKRSDEALYEAKRSGRNCAFFHDGSRCREIAPEQEPFRVSAVPENPGGAPATPTHKPAPDRFLVDENFDDISADLRRRMMEVAGRGESPRL